MIEDADTTAELSLASDAMVRGRSMDSIQSTFTNGSSSPGPSRKFLFREDLVFFLTNNDEFLDHLGLDPDISPDEQEEKARLISQVLELQNTLDGGFIFHLKSSLLALLHLKN